LKISELTQILSQLANVLRGWGSDLWINFVFGSLRRVSRWRGCTLVMAAINFRRIGVSMSSYCG
ncbi:MAG: hypothetical protein K2I37_07480, partial [Muribaculaceae bacterium]|nr:hypothetical protein [Muribaculaceae bacterium]